MNVQSSTAFQAAVSTINPVETIRVENHDWTKRRVMTMLKALQSRERTILSTIIRSELADAKELQSAANLHSEAEVKTAIRGLREQLRANSINPQEVFYADYSWVNGRLKEVFYPTGTMIGLK